MEIKVKNKKVSYTEKLEDNLYTIEASYTKPATRSENAKEMHIVAMFNFYMTDAKTFEANEKKLDAGLTIYLNNKYISARSSIGRGLNPSVSGWVSSIEYASAYANINTMTEADANLIGELIQLITSNSEVLNFDELRNNIKARDFVYALKENKENEKEARATLAKLKEEYETLLAESNLDSLEASTLVQLVNEGAIASTMLQNITKLMA